MAFMDPNGPERTDPVEHDETISFDPVEEARALRGREAAAGIPGLSGFALVVASGPGRGRHFLLDEGEHEAGRNPAALIFLDDITVSRHHAAFRVAEERLSVHDLGSTNGTYVNGQRVESAELQPGDEVIVGRFHLVVTRGA
jgi:pSer/pThr/pTyr-binding forkhead associated (FHA) protein